VQQISRTVKKSLTFSSRTAHYSEQTDHFAIHYLRYGKCRKIQHWYETH